jgi:hypothetical protein
MISCFEDRVNPFRTLRENPENMKKSGKIDE